MPNEPTTITTLIATYARDLAYITEQEPATTLAEFTAQLRASAPICAEARIPGTDEFHAAANTLEQANRTDRARRRQLLTDAAFQLLNIRDMATTLQFC